MNYLVKLHPARIIKTTRSCDSADIFPDLVVARRMLKLAMDGQIILWRDQLAAALKTRERDLPVEETATVSTIDASVDADADPLEIPPFLQKAKSA